MRKIDADELKETIKQQLCTCDDPSRMDCIVCSVGDCLMFIDEAPTICEEASTKAAAIMQHYGAQHQLVKLCEECGELIQQAVKCIDKGIPYGEDFIEELADVSVMIEQFKSILTPAFAELYEKIITEKLDRQMQRIDDERVAETEDT